MVGRRRTSRRQRKAPDRFAPSAADGAASEDFPPLEPLALSQNEWETRRVLVEWDEGWFKGTVVSFDQGQEGRCEVLYDDDDREQGKLGSGIFRVFESTGGQTDKAWRFLGPDSRANSQVAVEQAEIDPDERQQATVDKGSPNYAEGSSLPPASCTGQQPQGPSAVSGAVPHFEALPEGVTLGIPAGAHFVTGQPMPASFAQADAGVPAATNLEDQPLKSRLASPTSKGIRKVTGGNRKQVRKPAAKQKDAQAAARGGKQTSSASEAVPMDLANAPGTSAPSELTPEVPQFVQADSQDLQDEVPRGAEAVQLASQQNQPHSVGNQTTAATSDNALKGTEKAYEALESQNAPAPPIISAATAGTPNSIQPAELSTALPTQAASPNQPSPADRPTVADLPVQESGEKPDSKAALDNTAAEHRQSQQRQPQQQQQKQSTLQAAFKKMPASGAVLPGGSRVKAGGKAGTANKATAGAARNGAAGGQPPATRPQSAGTKRPASAQPAKPIKQTSVKSSPANAAAAATGKKLKLEAQNPAASAPNGQPAIKPTAAAVQTAGGNSVAGGFAPGPASGGLQADAANAQAGPQPGLPQSGSAALATGSAQAPQDRDAVANASAPNSNAGEAADTTSELAVESFPPGLATQHSSMLLAGGLPPGLVSSASPALAAAVSSPAQPKSVKIGAPLTIDMSRAGAEPRHPSAEPSIPASVAPPQNASIELHNGQAGRSVQEAAVMGTGSAGPAVSTSPMQQQNGHAAQKSQKAQLSAQQVDQEVLMVRMKAQLTRLIRTKDSIHRATTVALEGAALGAAPRIIRTIAEQLKDARTPAKRIDLFYLVDSIAQVSQKAKDGNKETGPESLAGKAFARVIAAALPHFIPALAADPETFEKARKVLSIWRDRGVLQASVLKPALDDLVRRKPAEQPAPGPTGPQGNPQMPSAPAGMPTAVPEQRFSAQVPLLPPGSSSGSRTIQLGEGSGVQLALRQESDDEEDDEDDDGVQEQAAAMPIAPLPKQPKTGGRKAHGWMLPEGERTPDLAHELQPTHCPPELQDPPGIAPAAEAALLPWAQDTGLPPGFDRDSLGSNIRFGQSLQGSGATEAHASRRPDRLQAGASSGWQSISPAEPAAAAEIRTSRDGWTAAGSVASGQAPWASGTLHAQPGSLAQSNSQPASQPISRQQSPLQTSQAQFSPDLPPGFSLPEIAASRPPMGSTTDGDTEGPGALPADGMEVNDGPPPLPPSPPPMPNAPPFPMEEQEEAPPLPASPPPPPASPPPPAPPSRSTATTAFSAPIPAPAAALPAPVTLAWPHVPMSAPAATLATSPSWQHPHGFVPPPVASASASWQLPPGYAPAPTASYAASAPDFQPRAQGSVSAPASTSGALPFQPSVSQPSRGPSSVTGTNMSAEARAWVQSQQSAANGQMPQMQHAYGASAYPTSGMRSPQGNTQYWAGSYGYAPPHVAPPSQPRKAVSLPFPATQIVPPPS
ncbi:hypothetical protein WJX74_004804 [Apatococcus lobatus]|uniref:CID domain-containing protein n=1 Tax=Apatococcus lobatus TaxID=904363 RepID=A0AAW1QHV9_9CHLO